MARSSVVPNSVSTTELVEVNSDEYANVSLGNLNCYVAIEFGNKFRVIVGGIQPAPDAETYFELSAPSDDYYDGWRMMFGADNLEAETEIWMRAEEEDAELTVTVVRGSVILKGFGNAA